MSVGELCVCAHVRFPVIEKYPIPSISAKDDIPRNKQDMLTCRQPYGESPKRGVEILEELLLLRVGVQIGIVAVVKMPI